ncbi:spore cortex-lytic enzyme [Dehalobacterium formicoaceticum]|uniref:Spore cortex-lytic enzyme n=1 Tax=Dehalobacterium formicoaceticum TaxID=51515 RepID=A0ABT1Y374_9FIRM|nr:spore cortex-lytic enzyme [Dehalobacterium formicoaceticum]MCR6544136.1 spore cortex-lytic enzyme [Dehalobacterium formicoaceticum]
MKNKKIILLVSFIFMMAAVVILTYGSGKAQSRPTLYWGSSGNNVTQVQQRLSNWGYYKGPIDGYLGASTFNAIKDFQRRNGLTADGTVGTQTYNALGLSSGSTTPAPDPGYQPSKVSVSGDSMLLARAIHAEAESEPYIGKVAVGAVLLNRVANANFPNTLAGVVYQGRALESVANGRVNTEPNNDSVKAAREALNGWDPSYGCLYFWNPSKPVSAWIWTRKIVVKYGAHVFGL